MFKSLIHPVWAFDLEWVPDPHAGRLVYNLPDTLSDEDVLQEMWNQAGADEENPKPYLKTILCRVVSVAAVTRDKNKEGKIELELRYFPKNPDMPMPEQTLIENFLKTVGKLKPQLVGFNSSDSDLPILLQRGVAKGVSVPDFCERPDKPWEGVDYFSQFGEYHIDLRKILGSWGKATPSLHELAQVSGIPGKMDTSGSNVVDLWLAGKMRDIVEYNQYDALTTYLVWLRVAYFAGLFSLKQYISEQDLVRQLIEKKINEDESHLSKYLERWELLKKEITRQV